MSRTPWMVDDEQSRLKAEIRESQFEPADSGPERPRDDHPLQQIEGHHDIQVTGNLTLQARDRVNPHLPGGTCCPEYRHWTYRRSDWCTQYHFNLSGYRIERAKQEHRRRLMTIILHSAIPVLLVVFVGTKFLAGTAGLYFLWDGAGLLATAGLAALLRVQV